MAGDELCHELEVLIQSTQHVHDECVVRNGLTKVGKGVGHALHLAAEVINGEGTLREVAELGVKKHGSGFAIVHAARCRAMLPKQ